ncbi:transmembrane 220 family protein [Pontibacter russatus]|uniref:transmembrane 220 family protein n=1 Tax=Pontibacter russatus TaxID=2694929 RepID=UPI00137A9F03|nr:transmembrane 220 family protein [Pontibacter russatus]
MLLKKTLGVIFGILFLSFAAFQYNDPDPLIWVTIYLIAAVLSFAAGFGRVSNAVLAVACVVYIGGVVYWWPERFEGVGDSMRDAATGALLVNVEEGRESLGMAICAAAMLTFILLSRFGKTHEANRTAL